MLVVVGLAVLSALVTSAPTGEIEHRVGQEFVRKGGLGENTLFAREGQTLKVFDATFHIDGPHVYLRSISKYPQMWITKPLSLLGLKKIGKVGNKRLQLKKKSVYGRAEYTWQTIKLDDASHPTEVDEQCLYKVNFEGYVNHDSVGTISADEYNSSIQRSSVVHHFKAE